MMRALTERGHRCHERVVTGNGFYASTPCSSRILRHLLPLLPLFPQEMEIEGIRDPGVSGAEETERGAGAYLRQLATPETAATTSPSWATTVLTPYRR